jgi:UDP-N-acetylmuramoylalanine--D-glutamate ligase
VAAGANLGPAALSLPLLPDDGVYALEMSSYMLERLETLRFDVAAMLNLSPDHLDRHGDMAGYAAAKLAIFARQTAGDVAVIGIDDAQSEAMAEARPRAVRISGCKPADFWADGFALTTRDLGRIFDLRHARALAGVHNAQNAAAATAMALALGVTHEAVAEGLRSFPGLAHRQEQIATVAGVRFINDSKATNADAAARALGCFDRVVWIAGGIAKEGGIASLHAHFPRIAEALLIGRDADTLSATLKTAGVAYRIVETLERAVPAAFEAARGLDASVVLLSPACASFDQFSGFEARGEQFRKLVLALADNIGAVH